MLGVLPVSYQKINNREWQVFLPALLLGNFKDAGFSETADAIEFQCSKRCSLSMPGKQVLDLFALFLAIDQLFAG